MVSCREIEETAKRLQAATKLHGYNVICAFNDRYQELEEAHPGFRPSLLPHEHYVRLYNHWHVISALDSDLTETHPHNNIRHTHSLTRLLARRDS